MLDLMEQTTLMNIYMGDHTQVEDSVLQIGDFELEYETHSNIIIFFSIGVDYLYYQGKERLVTCGMQKDLCMDPTGSWNWILILIRVVGVERCFQPAKTTVLGVSFLVG